jgi:hypothetical protein
MRHRSTGGEIKEIRGLRTDAMTSTVWTSGGATANALLGLLLNPTIKELFFLRRWRN